MTRIPAYLVCLLSLSLFISANTLEGGNEKKTNTIPAPLAIGDDASKLYSDTNNSVIARMSDEQLTRLIDMLFEMDSIPADLVKEITRVVNARKEKDAGFVSEVVKNTVDLSDSMPATGFYSVWDVKHIAPIEDLLVKNDTSFTLQLTNDIIGNYSMPYCGNITSWFGWRDSTNHYGIDIKLNRGDPVVAAFEGKVRIAKREGGFGNVVIIRHYNGLETIYAHLSKIKVKQGQVVQSGQLIGLGGSTGHSTGPHLHFEMRFKGVPINPCYIISVKDENIISSDIVIHKSRWGMTAYPLSARMYTVAKGDRLKTVAQKNHITTKKLRELNAVNKGSLMYLRVGQDIRVE